MSWLKLFLRSADEMMLRTQMTREIISVYGFSVSTLYRKLLK
ncbi:Protein of unknown function [Pyronema omphalodes CBS 100304]|uniref:Uncharacterized protein n=1 Tax=Pyronema omphalodes (strain CBS 100304) TaxID=1076935 RepID=U4LLF7_PYROM|nr:Protein of unknown function [Pyronema omphalodes CBS 100304]